VKIEFDIAGQEVGLECPACGLKFRVRVLVLLDPERTSACPACGQLFRATTSIGDVRQSVARAAEKAIGRRIRKGKERKERRRP
jgi:uncharacterized C2H2 Zn-finger protein